MSAAMLGIALLCLCRSANAQIDQLRYYSKDKRSIDDLRERAQKEYPDAIYAIGYRDDAVSIPLLRHLAETSIPSQEEIDKINGKPKNPKNPSERYLRVEEANEGGVPKAVEIVVAFG
jgi:hypothetical protein